MKTARVLLAGDSSILLAAFTKLVESEFELAGIARDEQTLVLLAAESDPDVVVLDVSIPSLQIGHVAHRLGELVPEAKLIVLDKVGGIDEVRESFRHGAMAYLLRTSEVTELGQAIRKVLKDEVYVTPMVAQNLASTLAEESRQENSPVSLTTRQREVLVLLVQGSSMRKIATTLNISPRTVAFHKYRMMSDLDISTSAELIGYAIKHSIS
jgi:DNA-binding NarL/FixJ family response regulator